MTITAYDAPSLARLGTVLGVWAHPDDETYSCGGLFAAAAAAGGRVVCVTATRGEAGSLDHERWPPASLAATRTRELDEALATLGVREHHWLDYPDGGCAGVPQDEAVRRIAELIDDVRPDTVLTFGPDGFTGHPDHIAVGHWTAAALVRSGSTAALHCATITPQGWGKLEELFFTLGMSMGGRPDVTDAGACSINVELPDPLRAVKERAVRAQVSQTAGIVESVGEDRFDLFIATESFRLSSTP
ncbi:MAG: N-acetyl-D-myo-inositol-2-amino-2-deoxy-alpha-D-glucopyranoside deacetylase [Frankiaceae bacterium]|jgi:LmbE family N-acetylglucosaminyl deacetylase|nr:N-acetyl-D-myo-inositol-2-amino-2-deoxy-alpha-D-glucopyranoside deacetylase [Frankiaceae bacterium]